MAIAAKTVSNKTMMSAVGNIVFQIDSGMFCSVSHAENVFSFPIERCGIAALRERMRAAAQIETPHPATSAMPAMRNFLGIRSHTVAAHKAKALHILIE